MTTSEVRDELLMAYAAGRVAEPVRLVLDTHLALSPRSRRAVRCYEAIGGALLETVPPEPLEPDALDRIMSCLDSAEPLPRRRARAEGDDQLIPAPLQAYLPPSLDDLEWVRYGPVAEAELLADVPGYRTRLLRIKAGKAVPRHTHEGSELTVVLQGAFRDGGERYARGDLSIADASVDHRPVAEEGEDCLCLAVTDAPLKLTGRFTRFLNPFVRI